MTERCVTCGRAPGHSETCSYCVRQEEREACAALVLSVDPTSPALRVIAARIRRRGSHARV